ncbi:MAG: tetratricopeptide repeat protein [Pseudomonadota bacterium]
MQCERDSIPAGTPLAASRGRLTARIASALLLVSTLALAGCDDDRPSPALADFQAAIAKLEQGDVAGGEALLRSALESDPSHALSHAALGRIDEARGKFASALAHYEDARDRNETNPEGHWQLGRLALDRGLLSDALRHCTAAQHLGPTDASIMTLRSRLMQRVGLLQASEEVAREALSRRSGDQAATLQLAAVRVARAGPEAGLDVLRAAETQGIKIPVDQLLVLFDRLGRPGEAINMLFGRLVDASPEETGRLTQALARRLINAGRPAQAVSLLEARLVEQPRDADALALRARLAMALEGPEAAQARILAGSALAGEPGGKTERTLVAMIERMAAGEGMDATGRRLMMPSAEAGGARPLPGVTAANGLPLATLEAALVEAGDSAPPVLRALVGEARAKAGDTNGARQAFDRAVAESLGAVQVLEIYARALNAQGDAAGARSLLADYRAQRQGDRRLLALLGAHLLAAGDHAGAAALAEAAFRDVAISGLPDPYAESLLAAAVEAAVASGAASSARDYAEAAAAAEPGHAAPHVLLARLHAAAGRRLQAIDAARRAIDLMPGRAEGYLTLAQLLAAEEPDAAMAVLDRGIARSADTAALRFARALQLERQDDDAGAIAEYERLLAIEPAALVVVNNLASLIAGGPHTDDLTREELDRASALAVRLAAHDLPEFADTRGWIAVKAGDAEGALPLLERAAAARPEHPVIHYHLGIALYRAGHAAAATERLRYMLSLDSEGAMEYENEAVRVLARVERQGSAVGRRVD